MPGKELLRGIGVTEDLLQPHLRKKRIGRLQNSATVSSVNTNVTVKSGEITTIECAESIVAGQYIHIGANGKAYHPNTTNKSAYAFAVGGGETGANITVILSGIVGVISNPADIGKKIYLSDTYPFYSITPTLATNKYYQILGAIKGDVDLIVAIEPPEMKL